MLYVPCGLHAAVGIHPDPSVMQFFQPCIELLFPHVVSILAFDEFRRQRVCVHPINKSLQGASDLYLPKVKILRLSLFRHPRLLLSFSISDHLPGQRVRR